MNENLIILDIEDLSIEEYRAIETWLHKKFKDRLSLWGLTENPHD